MKEVDDLLKSEMVKPMRSETMYKLLTRINGIFERYDCHLLGNLEEIADSFGNSEYDEYWWYDLCFTNHSMDGNLTFFMTLADNLKIKDFDYRLQIARTHYSLNFKTYNELLLAQTQMDRCERIVKEINEKLKDICLSWYYRKEAMEKNANN